MGHLYVSLDGVAVLEGDADSIYSVSYTHLDVYKRQITYGTNNELGFDYLRDNMVVYKDQMVQRELHYAIVDEVDSILSLIHL